MLIPTVPVYKPRLLGMLFKAAQVAKGKNMILRTQVLRGMLALGLLMVFFGGCGSDTGVCEVGQTQDGTTVCGLNDEGVFEQECVAGAWQDTTTCTGTDVCENDLTQNGTTPCGLNDEGVFTQICVAGAWQDTTTCTGTDVCEIGQTQNGTTLCGLNDEGVFTQDCVMGAWQDTTTCTGTDACETGLTQNGTTVCGLNGEGVFTQDCVAGAWQDTTTCTGTDVCLNGSKREDQLVCGPADEGFFLEDCTDGAWASIEICMVYNLLGAGECRQGDGEYPAALSITYGDLEPHTTGDNAAIATARCKRKCAEHSDWCFAAQVVTNPIWPAPSCYLITDNAAFTGAGNTWEHDSWGGIQTIDGESYQTYCGGGSTSCVDTVWGGGSLSAREGYNCFVFDDVL
jgi:hypothetical protein